MSCSVESEAESNQDLETGCPKLTIVKCLGILFFKGDYTILKEYYMNLKNIQLHT